MTEDIIISLQKQIQMIRTFGICYFDVEVHLTEKTIEQIKTEMNIENDDTNKTTFAGYPVIVDNEDYICAVHKTRIIKTK